MWTKVKQWVKENFTALCIFTLIVIGLIIGVCMFPKWSIILTICLGYFGWITYKIIINQKL